MIIVMLMFSSVSEARFGVKISLAIEKRRSTASLEGIEVLFLTLECYLGTPEPQRENKAPAIFRKRALEV